MRDDRYVASLAALFESVVAQGRAAYRPGVGLAEFRAAVQLDSLAARFSHGDDFIRRNFDAQLGLAVGRMYQELRGTLTADDEPDVPSGT